MENKKKIHLEVMRILACFFVIYHHTYIYPEQAVSGLEMGMTLFWGDFCCFAVPLFFMISGALLLGKENESIATVWKKRILQTAVTLLFFSFVYYMRLVILGYKEFSIIEFLKQFYSSDWNYSYWYLYNYIGYLMCLPLLRNMVKNMSDMCFRYMFVIAICFISVIPVAEYFIFDGQLAMNDYLIVPLFTTNCLLYPVLGYYLEHKMAVEKMKKYLLPIWILDLLFITATCYMAYRYHMDTNEFTQSFYGHAMIFNCLAIYMTGKCFLGNIKSKILIKIVISLGSATLGIYLLHILLRECLDGILNYWMQDLHINYIIAVFMFDAVIFAAGYLITIILKRIPLIKRIV